MDKIAKLALSEISNNFIDREQSMDDEAEILSIIERRVTDLLDHNPDLLMSYLYRLDVEEYKIKLVLKGEAKATIPQLLAHLIWNRQKQRALTKLSFASDRHSFWDDID